MNTRNGGEHGIRTHETVLAVYTISNRAPSTSSDNSPYSQIHNKYIASQSTLILYPNLYKKSRGKSNLIEILCNVTIDVRLKKNRKKRLSKLE